MNIGIDLGTTNSALAYHRSAAKRPKRISRRFACWMFRNTSRRGASKPRRTLPSFLYLGDQEYVGVYAREQGALVPTKCVHSAKSWLSNPAVDRTAKILPWDAQESRPRAFAGGSFDAHSQASGRRVGERNMARRSASTMSC